MPTGYTAGVQDGSITEFKDFAMQCARTFGALVMMRDDPMDSPIPKFEPHTSYHDKAEAEARALLIELDAMTVDTLSKRWNAEREESMQRWEESEAKRKEQRARYEAMLVQVYAWNPPTSDHTGLKDFMVKQLEESIEFDARPWPPPVMESPSNWFTRKKVEAERDIAYHVAERKKEIERTEGRNQWVKQLRDSLPSR